MGRRKTNNASNSIAASGCKLERVPPQVFGVHVLRLLTLKELCKMDIAVSDSSLRRYWWSGPKKSPHLFLDVCLRHATDQQQTISVHSDNQASWLWNRRIACSSYHIKADNIRVPSFRYLIFMSESPGWLQMRSLHVHGLADNSKVRNYLHTIAQCHHLHHLHICVAMSMNFYIPEVCHEVIANNPELETITLEGKIAESFFPSLKNAKALKKLHIHRFFLLYVDWVYLFPLKSQLESLSLTDCYGALNRQLALQPLLSDFFSSQSNLPIRHLDFSSQACGTISLNDDNIRGIALSCPLLESLFLVGDTSYDYERRSSVPRGPISDAAVVFLAQRCPRLRKLSLHNQKSISSVAIEALLIHCPDISYIIVFGTAVSNERQYIDKRSIELAAEGRAVTFSYLNV